MSVRYVNPFTDFGFKKLFGEEASKPHLKDFLNSFLPAKAQIKDFSFTNSENFGKTEADRKAIFDIYCEGTNGVKFIVEMQKAKQNYFKDRTVFYSSFPIQKQAQRGDWNYKLDPIFCVGVLDFCFDAEPAAKGKKASIESGEESGEVVHTVQLKDQNNRVFYDKLTYIYLEMPHFKKQEHELETRLDKWLYFLRHLQDLEAIPQIFGGEEVFSSAFAKAELAGMSPVEHEQYEASLKVYRDLKGVIDTAREEGHEEGLEKGRKEGLEKGREEGLALLNEARQRLQANGFTETQVREMLGF